MSTTIQPSAGPKTYNAVCQDLKIEPALLQNHDMRTEQLVHKHRSRMLKPDGSIQPVRRERSR